MGIDFIRQRAKPFTRSWDQSRIELCERDLFTIDPQEAPRTIVARTTKRLESGSRIRVCSAGPELNGYDGVDLVAEFVTPPSDLVESVARVGGHAVGIVVAVLTDSVIEVQIC